MTLVKIRLASAGPDMVSFLELTVIATWPRAFPVLETGLVSLIAQCSKQRLQRELHKNCHG